MAAKNEVENIERFINTVKNLDYPEEKFELIVVDDNSIDNTYIVAKECIGEQKNFRLIKADTKTIDSKRGALLKGIESSHFPFIVITDADCIPSVMWLKSCAGQFEKGNEFIFGPAPFFFQKNLINKISSFENLKNQYLSFSLSGFKIYYTSSARNMGFSKDAFYRIGGYDHTFDTLSGDDDLLLREALKNKLKITAFYNIDAMVLSFSKNNLNDYLRQKARHTQSSFHYLLKHKIILAAWHLLNLFMILSPLLIFLNYNLIWLFITKLISDTVVILIIQKKFRYKFSFPEILYYDFLYEMFIVLNFFNALFKKIEWK